MYCSSYPYRNLKVLEEGLTSIVCSQGRKKSFSNGAFVSHHCCGSSVELIPRFIELKMEAIQTIQPQAAGMNPYALKRTFSGRITLHGAVDLQGWLQQSKPEEIREEVLHLIEEVGAGGGFILGPCHNIQPETPLGNVLEL